jgi:glutamate N-acetyltransferase / amino-acid N-acetyltransferase
MTAVDRSLGVTAARGFAAAGVTCGLKESGAADLALVAGPEGTVAAGTFATNVVVAAPVVWSRALLAASPDARVVVLNSGNANACTGPQGHEAAAGMATATAREVGCRPDQVLVCSTGVIGVPLDLDLVAKGIRLAAADLSPGGGARAAAAILTTDSRTKQAGIELDGGVRLGGMAKGAAMLAPAMELAHATMLAVVTTDALVDPAVLRAACAGAVHESFNQITVDGSQSTNDTVLVLASGASGIWPAAGELHAGLTAVCADLARQMLEDAEGGSRTFTVSVGGAAGAAEAATVARRVADSPLVKAAVHGGDPNWGRVLQAAGTAGVGFDPDQVSLELRGAHPEPVLLVAGGVPVGADPDAAAAAMSGAHLEFRLDLGGAGSWASVHAADLTPEYVRLNSEYTT